MTTDACPVADRRTALLTSSLGLLPMAIVLIFMGMRTMDHSSTVGTIALIAAAVIVLIALVLASSALHANRATSEQARRDRETLDALEPLRMPGDAR
ncbi:hypothetical protein CTZ27_02425 [Streptomyces griseocarneus]|nr:hypothetical protein CTZ27_02425 [Streptomyces griseocarneus]